MQNRKEDRAGLGIEVTDPIVDEKHRGLRDEQQTEEVLAAVEVDGFGDDQDMAFILASAALVVSNRTTQQKALICHLIEDMFEPARFPGWRMVIWALACDVP